MSIVFLLFISVAFSALSSTLTINGKAAFRVVKDIRISSITLSDSSTGVENSPANYGTNEVMGNITLNRLTDNVTYNVVINNVGNVDQVLTSINDVTFTNSNIDYTITNLTLNQTILATNTLTFSITFNYKNTITSLPTNKALAFKIHFGFIDSTLGENLYIGQSVSYLGKAWHIIATNSTTTTLFADSGEFSAMAHCLTTTSTNYCYWASSSSNVKYKWSKSQVNYYLNNTWLNTVDSSSLQTSSVCDDIYTGNGGALSTENLSCTNGFVSSYVRLLTKAEYNSLKTSLTDTSWLYSSKIGNYWLQNTGNVNFAIVNINSTGAVNVNSSNGVLNADHTVAIRPVITVTTSAVKNATNGVSQINISSRKSNINQNGLTYIPLGIGDSNQLNASLVPTNAQVTLTWSTSNNSIATVSNTGLITGISSGKATITCSYNNVSDSIVVEVAPNYNSATTYSPGDYVLYESNIYNVVSDNGTYLKLLASADTIGSIYSCYATVSSSYCYWTSNTSYVDYKWSLSYTNNYLNNTWLPSTSITTSNLQTSSICDADMSGSNGGKLTSEATCPTTSVTSYARLLTVNEYNTLKTANNASTWLYNTTIGNWRLSDVGSGRMQVYFVNTSGSASSSSGDTNADHKMLTRPVIIIIK